MCVTVNTVYVTVNAKVYDNEHNVLEHNVCDWAQCI